MQQDQAFFSEQQEAYDVFKITGKPEDIVPALRRRIERSDSFFKSDRRYQIEKTRKNNQALVFGDPYQAGYTYIPLTQGSVKYTEPQIYVGLQTIISFLTAQLHEVEARPFNDTTAGHVIARDFEKYAQAHGIEHDLVGQLVRVLWDLLGGKRVGILKMTVENGEIIPRHVDPARIVFDHNVGVDDKDGFVAEKVKCTIQKLVERFPEKKAEIYKHCRIDGDGDTKLGAYVDYYEAYVTGMGAKGEPEEQLVCFLEDIPLNATKNHNWLYDVEADEIGNYLSQPPKPYLTINLLNDGSCKLDYTSLPELVANMQHAINRRKRSISEQAERWAGLKVWSSTAVDLDDVEDLTGQPDESIIVDSEDVGRAITKIPPDYMPQFFFQDVDDMRKALHSVLGTPPNMRGDQSESDTLGEAIIERNQAQGRMETLVRALDSFMNRYYALLFQMIKVHYTEEHWKTLAGEDGTYDYVMMHRDRLKDGLDVRAKAGSNIPVDDAQMANVAVKIAGRLSTIDLYKLLKLPHPEKMYENYTKDQVDPTLLVKDLKIDEGDRTADMDYEVIKAGKDAPPREDVEAGHIDRHREQMASDEFNTGTNEDGTPVWTPEMKQKLVTHVQAEMASVARRADAMEAKVGAMEAQESDGPMAMTPDATGAMPPPPAPALPGAQPGGAVAATPQNPKPMMNMV